MVSSPPHGFRVTPGGSRCVAVAVGPRGGRSPSPPSPPPHTGPSPRPRPAAVAMETRRHFRRAATPLPGWRRWRLFPPRPRPHGGPGAGGAPRPLTPHPGRALRGPAGGPAWERGRHGWRGCGDPGGPAAWGGVGRRDRGFGGAAVSSAGFWCWGGCLGGSRAAGRRIVPGGVCWGAAVPGDARGAVAGPGSVWERGLMGGSGGQGVFCGDFRCPALGGV